MRSNNVVSAAGEFSLPGLTFLLFLILQLIGTIHWSWWAITAPLWGPAVLFTAVAVFVSLLLVCARSLRH